MIDDPTTTRSLTRRAALLALAAAPTATLPAMANTIVACEISPALANLLVALERARPACATADAEFDAIWLAAGPVDDVRHRENRKALGIEAAEERLGAAYDRLRDVEHAIYAFRPASLADVRAKARVVVDAEDLKGQDEWIEAFVESLAA